MADRGIIFSAPMVRALLAGRKTQTRRLAKFVQPDGHGFHIRGAGGGMLGADEDAVQTYGPDYAPHTAGDRLYVRETWSGIFWDPEDIDGPARELWETPREERREDLCSGKFYREQEEARPFRDRFIPEGQWQPSIHMPRWASRMTLLVREVRVQRVQEVSEEDAIAEGIEPIDDPRGRAWKSYETYGDGKPHPHASVPNKSPVTSFRELWNSLHTKPGERWEDNPWIYALTFDVVRENIDRISA